MTTFTTTPAETTSATIVAAYFESMDLSSSSSEDEKVDNWSIGQFEFVKTLGSGTFGKVQLSKHKPSGNFYAIKVLCKKFILKMKQLDHIHNEKKILELCSTDTSSTPFVVKLHKTFQDDKFLYLVMDYVPGGELFTHLREVATFPNDVAKFYIAQVVLALEQLHANHVVYRDLKPENTLIDAKGYIKLTDFGFAKQITDRTWTLCGTPDYIAPEIVLAKGHGKAVDWWALGILTYEMLVGYPPFFDENPMGVYEKILHRQPRFPANLSPVSKDFIMKLLKKNPVERLGSFKEGALDIKRHPWFRGVNWEMLKAQQYNAPIRIEMISSGDTTYFPERKSISEVEQEGAKGEELTAEEQLLFKDF